MVTQGCCQLFLHNSTEPETMFPVLDNCAVQKCWAFQDMYERQTCTGVTVVTHGCCQLFLHSSSEAESMFPFLGKPAVHQRWAIADLYEWQICMGVPVVTQGCCQLFLQSSNQPESNTKDEDAVMITLISLWARSHVTCSCATKLVHVHPHCYCNKVTSSHDP